MYPIHKSGSGGSSGENGPMQIGSVSSATLETDQTRSLDTFALLVGTNITISENSHVLVFASFGGRNTGVEVCGVKTRLTLPDGGVLGGGMETRTGTNSDAPLTSTVTIRCNSVSGFAYISGALSAGSKSATIEWADDSVSSSSICQPVTLSGQQGCTVVAIEIIPNGLPITRTTF